MQTLLNYNNNKPRRVLTTMTKREFTVVLHRKSRSGDHQLGQAANLTNSPIVTYSFYRPSEGGWSSLPRYCMLKAVYRSDFRENIAMDPLAQLTCELTLI